jgi:hypothetical protein
MALPMSGAAWEQLRAEAALPVVDASLANQDDPMNVRVLAKALVAVRTGDDALRDEVARDVMSILGTERGARSLALGRELAAYIVSADLVGLPAEDDARFRAWLREVIDEPMAEGRTLRTTHEQRPNNWGTHAGASRAALAAYLGWTSELQRTAQVFRGWLGDRSAYAGFKFGDLAWQADAEHPVSINPPGSQHDGHSIDGVLPDDQRRAGAFMWPPPHENYVWEALQGAIVQAAILSRAGYDVWSWQDRALLRAYTWLIETADYPPRGDDRWQLPLVDFCYGTHYWDGAPTTPGKNMGWTEWTHAGPNARKPEP